MKLVLVNHSSGTSDTGKVLGRWVGFHVQSSKAAARMRSAWLGATTRWLSLAQIVLVGPLGLRFVTTSCTQYFSSRWQIFLRNGIRVFGCRTSTTRDAARDDAEQPVSLTWTDFERPCDKAQFLTASLGTSTRLLKLQFCLPLG